VAFTVRDGLLTEDWAQELGEWYQSHAPERDSVSYEAHLLLARTYKALSSGSRRITGLPEGRYAVLRVIYQTPGRRLPMSEIGRALTMSPANITKLIDGLEQEGLVRRVTNEDDKRVTWAEMTATGGAAFLKALPEAVANVDDTWSALTHDEKQLLVHMLTKLRMHLLTRDAAASATEGLKATAGAAC